MAGYKKGKKGGLYDEIAEGIEDEKEYWAENSEDAAESVYYPFYPLPKEQWKEIVPDYLLIGSDFAGGIIEFQYDRLKVRV